MNDAVDRVIVEREEMDQGLAGGVVLSLGAHALLLGSVVFVAILAPKEPLLKVSDVMMSVPAGGGGSPTAQEPAPGPPQPEPPKPEATLPPKPEALKVTKPPKEERAKGLPELDAKKTKKKPERAAAETHSGGTGTSTQTPGLEFGAAPGAGIPGGTDPMGDWYMAGVQRKIWINWNEQIRSGMTAPVIILFTIQADGQLGDVTLVQSCGVTLLDLAAKRAIYSAAPFGPLPKQYGNQYPIQGVFKPGS